MIRRANGTCFDERLARQAAPNHTRQLLYQIGISQSFEHASKVSACAAACKQQAQATSDLPQVDFGNLYESLEDIQALYSAYHLGLLLLDSIATDYCCKPSCLASFDRQHRSKQPVQSLQTA